MILTFILGYLALVITVMLLWIWAALRRPRRSDQPGHSHSITLPPFLTRDHWRDRGRQDAWTGEEWSEHERNRGFPIPSNPLITPPDAEHLIIPPGAHWTTIDPTPDEPWVTTPPEKGALVLVKMRPHPARPAEGHRIIYAALSVTGRYLYAVDSTCHRWEDAIGWKLKPSKMDLSKMDLLMWGYP